jgi:hypothetical protein
MLFVDLGRGHLAFQGFRQFGLEDRMGQLLQQD